MIYEKKNCFTEFHLYLCVSIHYSEHFCHIHFIVSKVKSSNFNFIAHFRQIFFKPCPKKLSYFFRKKIVIVKFIKNTKVAQKTFDIAQLFSAKGVAKAKGLLTLFLNAFFRKSLLYFSSY